MQQRPTNRPDSAGLWTVKVNLGCEYLPSLTFLTRTVTAQFGREGGLASTGEIAVTVPLITIFSEGVSADALVRVCVSGEFLCVDEA
jgi:hypothetical protein